MRIRRMSRSTIQACAVIAFFAAAGLVWMLSSHAASPAIAVEAEQGTVSNPAAVQSDTAASHGSAVIFGGSQMAVHQVPASIPADCSSDVTLALNAWMKSVPDSSEIDFKPQGCYWVEGSLTLVGRNNLVIDGKGSTFEARHPVPTAATNRSQWHFDYGSDLTIRNMTLQGVNPTAIYDPNNEFDHNLFIRGSHTVHVKNIQGKHAFGDFISIAQGLDQTTIPSDITIDRVSADGIGRMGISCVTCDGLSVQNSVFNNIGYHVFDLEIEGDNRPGRHIKFMNNTVKKHAYAFFSVGTPFPTSGNDLSDITIAGNTMSEAASALNDCVPAISFKDSKIPFHTLDIENNTLLSRTDGISVSLGSSVTIKGNTVTRSGPECGQPAGISLARVTTAVISSNTLVGFPLAYRTDSTDTGVTNCGNWLAPTALFTDPVPCQ